MYGDVDCCAWGVLVAGREFAGAVVTIVVPGIEVDCTVIATVDVPAGLELESRASIGSVGTENAIVHAVADPPVA